MSTDLFGVDTETKKPDRPRDRRDIFFAPVAAARRKAGLVPEWDWIHVDGREHETRGILVEGSLRNESGAFVGKRTKVLVTDAEEAFEIAEYERTTGQCSVCSGYGDRFTGWSKETGHRYVTCGKCGGTGLAKP